MKKTILTIDDSKAIRFLLQTVLGKKFQMVTVPDAQAAMYYLLHRELPDLIIVDPQLPDMENWELVEQLSSSGLFESIPKIVLSGLGKEETEAKCAEFGVSAHFTKPFNPLEVKEFVEALLLRSNSSFTAVPG